MQVGLHLSSVWERFEAAAKFRFIFTVLHEAAVVHDMDVHP